jgi:hypothetical protein
MTYNYITVCTNIYKVDKGEMDLAESCINKRLLKGRGAEIFSKIRPFCYS